MQISKRIVLPNHPHHIVHRGHNRQILFAEDDDFKNYLGNIQELKKKFDIKVFAYCLMTNHIHLLLQPGDNTTALGLFMKTLAGRTTRNFNRLEGRTGTLWESKYKSSPIQMEQYLMSCCRYIELNPVRANIVKNPSEYCWSSYNSRICTKINTEADEMKEMNDMNEIKEMKDSDEQNKKTIPIDFDPAYLGLGETDDIRREKYKAFLNDNISSGESDFIRTALNRGQLTGNTRFAEEVEQIIGRRIENLKPGRPKGKPVFCAL